MEDTDDRRFRTLALGLMIALAGLMALRAALAWPQLPATMASHFDARGVPNGYQSRAAFFALLFGVQALLGFVFAVVPRLMRHLPPSLINLPHREHWLTPERMPEALDRYATWSLGFGCFTFAFVLGIFELALRANLERAPMDPTLTWLLLGAYFAGTGIAIVRLYRRFAPPV